jgi:membrane fusion protein, multidrug efflux system
VLTLKIPRQILLPLAVALAGLSLMACTKPVEKKEDIRPVRVTEVAAQGVERSAEFSGEVKPRIESRLGFRVPGKILARKVDVGMLVKRGQLLLQLDPIDLQLAQDQARAGLKAAESNRDLAKAEKARFQELYNSKFVSKAILDAKETTFQAAQATVEQMQAALKGQGNQAAYTSLVSDVDGVVTALDAEVGQVVAAGTPVVRVAQTSEKEVQIGLPEDRVEIFRATTDVQVRLWADPKNIMPGKIREISPVADPVTRTYSARISLPQTGKEVKLGMTAYVSFVARSASGIIKLPLSAMFQEKNITSVWVVDKGVVQLIPVTVAGISGNDLLIGSGLQLGQKVVTAGVHVLKPGQKVKILESEGESVANAAGAAASASSAAASAGATK